MTSEIDINPLIMKDVPFLKHCNGFLKVYILCRDCSVLTSPRFKFPDFCLFRNSWWLPNAWSNRNQLA